MSSSRSQFAFVARCPSSTRRYAPSPVPLAISTWRDSDAIYGAGQGSIPNRSARCLSSGRGRRRNSWPVEYLRRYRRMVARPRDRRHQERRKSRPPARDGQDQGRGNGGTCYWSGRIPSGSGSRGGGRFGGQPNSHRICTCRDVPHIQVVIMLFGWAIFINTPR